MISAKLVRNSKGPGLADVLAKIPGAAKTGIETALETTQNLAVKFSRGRVADGIKIELVDTETWEVKGRVYTTSPFSAFLEYGTGIYMADNPLGHIPGSAGDRGEPWYVHEDMADLSKYNFPTIQTPTGMYYVIAGTKAHPYMQPAAFQSRESSIKAILKSLREMVRSVK